MQLPASVISRVVKDFILVVMADSRCPRFDPIYITLPSLPTPIRNTL